MLHCCLLLLCCLLLRVEYLSDLKCSRAYYENMSVEETHVIIDWLLTQAIAAEYSDHGTRTQSLNDICMRMHTCTSSPYAGYYIHQW